MRFAAWVVLVFFSCYLQATVDFDRQQIEENIRPIGQVRVQDADLSPPVEKAPAVVAKEVPGQAVYEHYCAVCHASGVAGAPKFQDKADWAPRTAKQDLNALTASAIKGLNVMPPKGTCAECTEADIKAAIVYMVPTS